MEAQDVGEVFYSVESAMAAKVCSLTTACKLYVSDVQRAKLAQKGRREVGVWYIKDSCFLLFRDRPAVARGR